MNEYTKYYVDQAGSGIAGFEGYRFHKGNGFFGRLLKTFAKPLLGYFGKKALNTGKSIVSDLASGESIKTSGKRRLKEALDSMSDDAARKFMRGSGYPARKRIKRLKPRRKATKKRVLTNPRKKRRKKVSFL